MDGAAMVRRLRAVFDAEGWEPVPFLDEIDRLLAESGLREGALFDRLAAELAVGFDAGRLEFEFCDRVVNGLTGCVIGWPAEQARVEWPAIFWATYEAFDAGEYRRTPGEDPVERYTRPMIREIVAGLTRREDRG